MRPPNYLLLFFLLLPLGGIAQKPYFPFFQQEYFFGHHPASRTEAMGKADVALGGSPSSLYYNPAGIGTIRDWQAMTSTSGPYYLLGNSDYHFVSFSKRINEKLVAALSLNHYQIGQSTFTIDIGNNNYEINNPTYHDLILTVSGEPLEGLHIGANAHLFSWKIFESVSAARATYFDFGALYELPVKDKGKLQFGVGIVNAFGSEIEFSAPDGATDDNWFPIIGRFGAAWMQKVNKAPFPLSYTVTAEYQDVFNFDYRTAFRVGVEGVVYDFLVLRLGSYTQTEDDQGVSTNLGGVEDITYGFGLILPVYKFTNGKIPVEAKIDYFSLRNPPLVSNPTRRANKRGFALCIISHIPSNK